MPGLDRYVAWLFRLPPWAGVTVGTLSVASLLVLTAALDALGRAMWEKLWDFLF